MKPEISRISTENNNQVKKDESTQGTSRVKIDTKDKHNIVKITSNNIDVYSKSKEVFLLSNKNNNIVKGVSKIIKNNKRKKDKYAGLCKAAVLASAHIKQMKQVETNKLNLFLKPSK